MTTNYSNLTVKINDRTGYSGAYVEEVMAMIEEAARTILERELPYLDQDSNKSWYINLSETYEDENGKVWHR